MEPNNESPDWLDEQLNSSAPSITPRTADLHLATRNLVSETKRATHRRHPRRLAAVIVGAVCVVALGGAGAVTAGAGTDIFFTFGGHASKADIAAAAAHPVPGGDFFNTSGKKCTAEFEFHDRKLAFEGDEKEYPRAVEKRAMEVGEAFYRAYDFSKIDVAAAAKREREIERKINEAEKDPKERSPRLSDEMNELNAITDVFFADLDAHVEAQGIPSRALNVETSWTCK